MILALENHVRVQKYARDRFDPVYPGCINSYSDQLEVSFGQLMNHKTEHNLVKVSNSLRQV